ncbi:hypothetical protein R1flu_003323 [Riccia fluitans]|uniref:Uncharacterized protein n=1 Tax=Riccia fluitans TaxID=41844 RepID=A0ABD1Y8T9_9MARC
MFQMELLAVEDLSDYMTVAADSSQTGEIILVLWVSISANWEQKKLMIVMPSSCSGFVPGSAQNSNELIILGHWSRIGRMQNMYTRLVR